GIIILYAWHQRPAGRVQMGNYSAFINIRKTRENRVLSTMTNSSEALDRNDYGKLIIRVMVAGLMLFHGIGKLMDPSGTLGWLGSTLESMHLPSVLGYGVYLGEVVGPIMVLA